MHPQCTRMHGPLFPLLAPCSRRGNKAPKSSNPWKRLASPRVADLTVQRFNDSPHLDGIKLNQGLSNLIKPSAAKFVNSSTIRVPLACIRGSSRAINQVDPIRRNPTL